MPKSLTDKSESTELTKAQFAYLHGDIDAYVRHPKWFRCGCFDLLPSGYYTAARAFP